MVPRARAGGRSAPGACGVRGRPDVGDHRRAARAVAGRPWSGVDPTPGRASSLPENDWRVVPALPGPQPALSPVRPGPSDCSRRGVAGGDRPGSDRHLLGLSHHCGPARCSTLRGCHGTVGQVGRLTRLSEFSVLHTSPAPWASPTWSRQPALEALAGYLPVPPLVEQRDGLIVVGWMPGVTGRAHSRHGPVPARPVQGYGTRRPWPQRHAAMLAECRLALDFRPPLAPRGHSRRLSPRVPENGQELVTVLAVEEWLRLLCGTRRHRWTATLAGRAREEEGGVCGVDAVGGHRLGAAASTRA